MRFLIDNALSHLVADGLNQNGHDAIHVTSIGLGEASDDVIFEHAGSESRIIISADTDFGTILATRGDAKPSVVLFRGQSTRRPSDQIRVLLANLPTVTQDLDAGAIVVFDGNRIRIRRLPLFK